MKYHISMRLLHWLMAVVIIFMLVTGIIMEDMPPSADKWELYSLHKSFGMLTIILIFLRVIARFINTHPPVRGSFWEKKLAHIVHLGLYLLMIIVPVSGYIMSMAGGYGISMFGISVPDIIGENKELGGIAHEIHEIAPYILIGLLVLHIIGVIKHLVIDKDNIVKKMI